MTLLESALLGAIVALCAFVAYLAFVVRHLRWRIDIHERRLDIASENRWGIQARVSRLELDGEK